MPLKLRMPSASSPRTSPADAATTGPASAAAGSSAASRSAKGQERTVIEPNFPCLGSEAIIGAKADGPRPHPRVAAIKERLWVDVGDLAVVQQILDIDRKSPRLNSRH